MRIRIRIADIIKLDTVQVRISPNNLLNNAAKILVNIPDIQVVQIIRKMKEDRSAKILEEWAKKGGVMGDKATKVTLLLRASVPTTTEESTSK